MMCGQWQKCYGSPFMRFIYFNKHLRYKIHWLTNDDFHTKWTPMKSFLSSMCLDLLTAKVPIKLASPNHVLKWNFVKYKMELKVSNEVETQWVREQFPNTVVHEYLHILVTRYTCSLPLLVY